MFELVLSVFNLICFPLAQFVVVSPNFEQKLAHSKVWWIVVKKQQHIMKNSWRVGVTAMKREVMRNLMARPQTFFFFFVLSLKAMLRDGAHHLCYKAATTIFSPHGDGWKHCWHGPNILENRKDTNDSPGHLSALCLKGMMGGIQWNKVIFHNGQTAFPTK